MNNYTSTCDTVNGTMLFEFGVSAPLNDHTSAPLSDHYAIFLDQRREVAKKLRNGEVMEQFSTTGMKIEEFARILINFGVGLLPPRPAGTPTSATLSAPPAEGN